MAQVITPLNNLFQTQMQKYGVLDQINNYSAPVYEKVNNVKEGYGQKVSDYKQQITVYTNQAIETGNQYKNLAIEKGLYYKGQAIEKSTYYKDVAIEKGKNHKVTKYSEEQLLAIVSFMEKKVQQLNDNYLHKSIGNENLSNEKVTEENLIKRIQNLSQTINVLARLTIQDQLKNIQQMPVTQKSVAMYQQLLSNPKVREAVIFTSITQEFLSDIIQTQLLTPSITFYDTKSQELKSQTKITIENVQSKVVKQYIPLITGKYETLKNSTIYFYENCMTIEFAQDYYKTNQVLVQKEMKDMYANVMQYQKTLRTQYQEVYSNALNSYKNKRMEKIANDEKKEEINMNEKKNE